MWNEKEVNQLVAEPTITLNKTDVSRSFMNMNITFWWPRWGVRILWIVTGVTSDIGVLSTCRVFQILVFRFETPCWWWTHLSTWITWKHFKEYGTFYVNVPVILVNILVLPYTLSSWDGMDTLDWGNWISSWHAHVQAWWEICLNPCDIFICALYSVLRGGMNPSVAFVIRNLG